jgi:hypothetical protein
MHSADETSEKPDKSVWTMASLGNAMFWQKQTDQVEAKSIDVNI